MLTDNVKVLALHNSTRKHPERLKIVGLDVTNEESVLKALEFVKNNLGHSNLWAVINNAGIYKGLAVELSSLQEFRDCMEVNAFGPIRVTKAFLPLIRKVKGRVVNVTSYGGRMAVPHMTPYIVSKFAVVGFNDCLRREMVDWGVRVISIEPEAFNTPMANNETRIKTFDEEIASLDSSIIDDYGLEYFKQYRKMMLMGGDFVAPNICRVVDALYSAVSLKYPDSIYMPCRNYLTELCNVLAIKSPVCMQDFGTQIFSAFVNIPKPKGATEDFEEVFSEKNLTK
ncbi:estradiol 17-beta-dehydrogenase 2 [Caerostris extrusa]|uniref:Estradiol 17-beta-dehydrogenase 2 n=1 Tax=Caerostris extrusa TaxID=172846 RepID=A0AAV4W1V5_CAEEX|nr:estradiol 17-beta-dehydrogenase 2 [Caerostris extrusa]